MAEVTDLAAAHVGLQLSSRLVGVLIDNGILTRDEAHIILTELARVNEQPGGGPANEVAAQILQQMAASYANKSQKN